MQQFSPHDFTAFEWAGSTDFLHYITVVLLLAVFLAAELNPFYLKVIPITLTLGVDSDRLPRAYCGWNLIIRSSSDDWLESSCVAYPPSGSYSSISMIQGLSLISLIPRMRNPTANFDYQESDQDGTAYMAFAGNYLHRAFGN